MAENKKKIKNDIIFIAAVVLILGIIVGATVLFREEGATVVVSINGKHYGTYSLAENQTIEIKSGKNNESYNVLVIENGAAYVSDANCPGVLAHLKCTNQKPIHYSGQSIICQEHMVVIEIKGGEEQSGPDFGV
jgi:hypothetical protein